MLPNWFKQLTFCTLGKLSYGNILVGRTLHKRYWGSFQGSLVAHLGCGKKYIPGFVNIDANPLVRADIWLDFTLGLPFPDESVDVFYARHVFEHLTIAQVRSVVKRMLRALKPGGGIRLVTPSLSNAINAYESDDMDFFPDWPHVFKSKGGRFNNYLLCAGQHRLMFDFTLTSELLMEAGFVNCEEVCWSESQIFSKDILQTIQSFEGGGVDIKSLYVEAHRANKLGRRKRINSYDGGV